MRGLRILDALLNERDPDSQGEEWRLTQRVQDLERAIEEEIEQMYPTRLGRWSIQREYQERIKLLEDLRAASESERPPLVAEISEALSGVGDPSKIADMDPDELIDAVEWMSRNWFMAPENREGSLWPIDLFEKMK